MDKLPPRGWRWVVFGAFLIVGRPALAQAPSAPKLADYFGFLPLELYKLDNRIGNLLLKDLDGDKIDDIIVSNNGRSRIDLLLSTKKPTTTRRRARSARTPTSSSTTAGCGWSSIPVNKEVVSVDTGDFNGDGKPDLVFYGTPAEVEILFNEGKGRFGSPKKINTGEAVQRPAALTVGDLDQDGRDDLALLAEKELVFVYQTATGILSEPERVPHTAGSPWLIKAVDIDGDGAKDLVILDTEATTRSTSGSRPTRRSSAPSSGSPSRCPARSPSARWTARGAARSWSSRASRAGPGADARPVGRRRGEQARPAGILRPAAGERARPVAGRRRPRRRQQERRHRHRPGQRAGLGLPPDGPIGPRAPARRFPAWATPAPSASHARCDGKDEVYVLSEQEKQIGRSVFDKGRLSFPDAPAAHRRAGRDGRGRPRWRQDARDPLRRARTEAGRTMRFELRAVTRGQSGSFQPTKWGEVESVALPGVTAVPPAIKSLDINHDGQTRPA